MDELLESSCNFGLIDSKFSLFRTDKCRHRGNESGVVDDYIQNVTYEMLGLYDFVHCTDN